MSTTLSIVADQQITLAAPAFAQIGQLRLVNGREISNSLLQDTNILLVRSVTRVNADMLRGTPVQFVGSATAGIDHIDLTCLQDKQIEFAYAPGSNARSVAEYVLSSLLCLVQGDSHALRGKTIGIIGVGEVGSRVQDLLEKLGMRCLLNDPPRATHETGVDWHPLEALAAADIISCHVPLNIDGPYATRHLINRQFLQCLKPDVILINTSRGDVIDEQALLEFVQAHPDARLVLDVWSNEPDINLPLLQQAAIATPHIAGYSYDGKLRATRYLRRALQEHLENEFPDYNEACIAQPVRLRGELDTVFEAVTAAYDVRLDSAKLKQAVQMTATERAACFDALRKHYPLRREFEQVVINVHAVSEQDKLRLQQLGFATEQT